MTEGRRGVQGDTGVRGDTGIRGDTGNQGQVGKAGKEGPRGATGAVGAPGESGARGVKGLPGGLPPKILLSFVAVVLVAFLIVSGTTVAYWRSEQALHNSRDTDKAQQELIKKNHLLAVQGKEAHDGLCTLKADLARRVEDTVKFLKEHPEGIAGIPIKTLNQSVANQRATLKSLGTVKCASDKPVTSGTSGT